MFLQDLNKRLNFKRQPTRRRTCPKALIRTNHLLEESHQLIDNKLLKLEGTVVQMIDIRVQNNQYSNVRKVHIELQERKDDNIGYRRDTARAARIHRHEWVPTGRRQEEWTRFVTQKRIAVGISDLYIKIKWVTGEERYMRN